MDEPHPPLVWIDLEMTGLDVERESIIEIATVVTDGELNIIAQGPNLAIKVDDRVIAGMDEWNTLHHHRSGLVDRIRNEGVTCEDAEQQTIDFLKQWTKEGVSPLCGNSVWNDRQFLQKEMPRLVEYLHYRMIDVSTIKELSRRWYPNEKTFSKKAAHLALDDILESIEELKFYRNLLFK
jgi:oligoribonuclease